MTNDETVVEREWTYDGIRCAVLFLWNSHRCGYVCVPCDNPAYGLSYDDIPLEVHGGLTFASETLSGVAMKKNDYWIGFDCAHSGDATRGCHSLEDHLWTKEEVIKETERLAEQLKSITWKKVIESKLKYMPDWFTKRIMIKL